MTLFHRKIPRKGTFDDNDGALADNKRPDSTENFENSDERSDKFEKSVLPFSMP